MKVELDFKQGTCKVIKESCDPHFHCTIWSSAESTFLYHVKKELIKQGFDVIKKHMWKDGNLVDDDQQYIRTRSWSNYGKNEFCIFNNMYAIHDAGLEFNKNGEYYLELMGEYNDQKRID